MFKTIKNIISILYSLVRFSVIKILRPREFVFFHIERFSPNTMINIWKGGKLKLGRKVRAHTGTRLSVTPNGIMEIGDNTTFNYNCILVARKRIIIGNDVAFGPNVVVYDHDHDFRSSSMMNGSAFKEQEIIIGNNVRIGANVVILRGARIGDNSVIAAGSVIRGEIPANSVAFNKKEVTITPYK